MNTGKADIGGWLKSKAEKLGEHVQEIRDNTKLIVQDVADGVKETVAGKKFREERYEVTFVEKPLGLELDLARGATVQKVKPRGQAETLSVMANDRLVMIAGISLPDPPAPGGKGVDEFIQVVKDRMSTMGRPVKLTFARTVEDTRGEEPTTAATGASADVGGGQGSGGEHLLDSMKTWMPKMPLAGGTAGSTGSNVSDELLAELSAARAAVQRYECDAALAREDASTAASDSAAALANAKKAEEECQRLRADLADLQLAQVWRTQGTEEAKQARDIAAREAEEARAELAAVSEALKREAAQHEEAARSAMEAARVSEQQRLAAERCEERAEESIASRFDTKLTDLEAALRAAGARADASASSAAAEQATCVEISEELSAARTAEATANSRAAEFAAECDAVQKGAKHRELTAASAERLNTELKKEVERLRAEVKRADEAAAQSAATRSAETSFADLEQAVERRAACAEAEAQTLSASLAAAEKQISDMGGELERLRQQALQHSFERPVDLPNAHATMPEPNLLGRQSAEHECVDAGDVMQAGIVDSAPTQVSSSSSSACPESVAEGALAAALQAAKAEEAAFRSRVAELEARNAGLMKQLNSRPIVYQFGPLPHDELEEEEQEDEEAPALGAASGSDVQISAVARFILVAFGVTVWLRRRVVKTAVAMRKTGPAKQFESRLRSFTQKLLTRPLLLWLFYAHVMALWVLVVYCQGRSQPTMYDPSNRLEMAMAASTRKPP